MSKLSTIKKVVLLPALALTMVVGVSAVNTEEASAWYYSSYQPRNTNNAYYGGAYDGFVVTRYENNLSPASPGYSYHATNPYGNGSSGSSWWSMW